MQHNFAEPLFGRLDDVRNLGEVIQSFDRPVGVGARRSEQMVRILRLRRATTHAIDVN
jgi:hypothetical protein